MGSGPVVHGAMGCDQKSFKLVWRCYQLLPGFLAKGQQNRVGLSIASNLHHIGMLVKIATPSLELPYFALVTHSRE